MAVPLFTLHNSCQAIACLYMYAIAKGSTHKLSDNSRFCKQLEYTVWAGPTCKHATGWVCHAPRDGDNGLHTVIIIKVHNYFYIYDGNCG